WELRNTPRMFLNSKQALLKAYRRIFKDLRPRLRGHYGETTPGALEVAEMPVHLAFSKPDAWYQPLDNSPGRFLVNTLYYEARPIWRMESLALRYGPPGSHTLFSAAASAELPAFRKYNGIPAFDEGWAWYVGTLGVQFGLFQDPHARYGHLVEEMIATVRLAVDTGIHSLGWSRQEALEFIARYTPLPAHRMSGEIDYIATNPGAAGAGKAGQRKFLELRDATAQEQGAGFNSCRFHERLLEDGPITFDLLEAKLAE
ncbi:MAG: DUF885 family protein, partial [Candidatus Marinimicrobia bacterium]|nr:DUF885 family protein [Candidatus Neomarinimicrobiota bacterium]